MSKQLIFFPGAYLSQEAIQINSNAENDLDKMISDWETRKAVGKVTTLEKLFSKLNELFEFPITITRVNSFNCNSMVNSFFCTDKYDNKGEIKLCASCKDVHLSLEVIIETSTTKNHIYYSGDFNVAYEEITTQVEDKTIKRVNDNRSFFDDDTTVRGWSIKIITKDNIVFQIQPNEMDEKSLNKIFNELSLSFCYDNIYTAEQLYLIISEKFKIYEHWYTRISELIDGKEHIRSSYETRQDGVCYVVGKYFEENKGCLQVKRGTHEISLAYFKNGESILTSLINNTEEDNYFNTKISIMTLDKIGDLGLIQRQINDNFKELCERVIIGHMYEELFRKKLNI